MKRFKYHFQNGSPLPHTTFKVFLLFHYLFANGSFPCLSNCAVLLGQVALKYFYYTITHQINKKYTSLLKCGRGVRGNLFQFKVIFSQTFIKNLLQIKVKINFLIVSNPKTSLGSQNIFQNNSKSHFSGSQHVRVMSNLIKFNMEYLEPK